MFVNLFLTFVIKIFILNIKRQGTKIPCLALSSRVQHIFDENPIPSRRIIHQHMGDSAHQFPVLNNGTAVHALDYSF